MPTVLSPPATPDAPLDAPAPDPAASVADPPVALADAPPAAPASPAPEAGDPASGEGAAAVGHRHFFIPIGVVEATDTSDFRSIAPNALTWRIPPIPLKSTIHSAHGNVPTTDPVTIGRVDQMERRDVSGQPDRRGDANGKGGTYPDGTFAIGGAGTYDTSAMAQEHARMIGDYMHNGVSADIGGAVATHEMVLGDDGEPIGEKEVLTSGEILAFTVVPMQAIGGCYIVCADENGEAMAAPAQAIADAAALAASSWRIVETRPPGARRCAPCERGDALVASAGPLDPPTAWFLDPELGGPTPMTITPEGRIYGHMAPWDACHTGIAGRCQPPPRQGNYAHFRLGAVLTREGDLIPTGAITMGGGHADDRPGVSVAATRAHYDDVSTALADVAAGEDEHGIWFAGAMRPEVTDAQVRALRASPLSGDWREIGGRLQLVACHAVNTAGFPVPRAIVAAGRVVALTAAGTPEMTELARRRSFAVDPAELVEVRTRLAAQEAVTGRLLAASRQALRARVYGHVA